MGAPGPPPRAPAGASAEPARSPWLGFSAVAVGTFMATLDGSIVNVALPTLRRELRAALSGVEWVVTAYLLVISVALLTAGRLGDLLGHRRVYVGGMLLFTLGSGLCGLAPGLDVLVAARAVQALGACAMMAMGPAVVTAIFPAHQRGRALGSVASVVALGLTAGPPLGGLIVQQLSWRWIFFVNLPVGVAGAVWAARALPAARPAHPPALDRRGAL
ncbi:MAG TPA: MFS transporter, partial [Anaeromyxobacteraceae bacterium]